MQLESLSLSQFRNISEASFHPDPALTVICGNNGQGKTNLLEAIWLFTGGKSFRNSKDVELIQKEQPFAVLEGLFSEPTGDDDVILSASEEHLQNQIRITIARPESERAGRQAKKNGVNMGRATNLVGEYPAVVFAPNHLSLVKGSPDGRRRFIDGALCQLYPNFITIYRRYLRAIAQKNACLKQAMKAKNQADFTPLLDVYDAELAKQGEEIQKRRLAYLQTLTPFAQQRYQEISNGAEMLSLKYQSQFEVGQFAQRLAAARTREIAAGCCLVGPHREDIEIRLNGDLAKVFASQGQQRSAVLSLKLAEAATTHAITGSHPAMLLDDVLSELDETRQQYLLTRMQGKQVFITSCDETAFTKTNGKIITMQQGVLQE